MKKGLLLALLLCNFLSFGQEYGLWLTSVDYSFNGGTSEYAYGVRASISPRGVLYTPIGLHNIGKNSSLTIRVNEQTRRGECSFYETKEINKYESLAGGLALNKPFVCKVNTLTKVPSELRFFACFAVLVPYYVQPTDNARSRNDVLFKTIENTFADPVKNIPEIIWQYNYNNKGFKEFPNTIKHAFPMKATVGDILINENIQLGKPLKVKAVLKNIGINSSNSDLPVISTNIFDFYIISSPPEFDNIKPIKTTCDYSVDGSFTLNLKRDLYTSDDETLVMTLYDENNVLINQEYTSNKLIDNKNGTFGYNWLRPLNAGNYTVKFQTHNRKETIDKDDPSWSSLIPIDFVIGKAKKVIFSITNISDETCFQQSNGYIEVNAVGEIGRTFSYQLTKEGIIQFYNGTSWENYSGGNPAEETWFPFVSENNTKISNLAKGNYRIKVKDSENCFAR